MFPSRNQSLLLDRPITLRLHCYLRIPRLIDRCHLTPHLCLSHSDRRIHCISRCVPCKSYNKDSLSEVALDPENLDSVVGQVMNRDVIFLREKQTVRDAIQMFLSSGISGAPVLNHEDTLVGVLSETDIIRREAGVIDALQRASWTANNLNLENLPLDLKKKPKTKLLLDTLVKDVMTKDPIFISASLPIVQAAILMINSQVNRLPVVEDGKVIGVLSRGDILQCMIWEILIAGSSPSEED